MREEWLFSFAQVNDKSMRECEKIHGDSWLIFLHIGVYADNMKDEIQNMTILGGFGDEI